MATITVTKNNRKKKFHTYEELKSLKQYIPLDFNSDEDVYDFDWFASEISACRSKKCGRPSCFQAEKMDRFLMFLRRYSNSEEVTIEICKRD